MLGAVGELAYTLNPKPFVGHDCFLLHCSGTVYALLQVSEALLEVGHGSCGCMGSGMSDIYRSPQVPSRNKTDSC